PKSPVCWRGSLCPILRFNRWLRKPLRPGSVETSIPAAVAATGSSGCSIPTARTTSFKSRAPSRAAACSRTFPLHAAKGWKRVPTTRRDNTSSTSLRKNLETEPLFSQVRSMILAMDRAWVPSIGRGLRRDKFGDADQIVGDQVEQEIGSNGGDA